MPPAPYPDFRWFFRSLRALPVVAIAALAGGIIGGFSVFALDLALTTPPNHEVGAEVGKIKAKGQKRCCGSRSGNLRATRAAGGGFQRAAEHRRAAAGSPVPGANRATDCGNAATVAATNHMA